MIRAGDPGPIILKIGASGANERECAVIPQFVGITQRDWFSACLEKIGKFEEKIGK